MNPIDISKVNCPGCGNSGSDLNADSQIEFTGHVDHEGWIACPDCGAYVDFNEAGDVTDTNGHAGEWTAALHGAMG